MRKYYLTSLCLLSTLLTVHCQGEFDKCYFGTAAVDFSNLFPQAITNSAMYGKESAASICDSLGNLLFYSNGGNSPTVPGTQGAIWNANHVIMENGILADSSGCFSSFHGAIAFPAPIESGPPKSGQNQYYLFTRDCVESSVSAPYYNSGLSYCLIDMNENGGLGKVIEKNKTVVPYTSGALSTSREPLSAVLNDNNEDWWVFSYNNDSLYSIEVIATSVGNYRSYELGSGQIVISPRRDKLIAGNKLYDFDASNANISLQETFNFGSAAFSSDGSKLYALESGTIKQYDLDAPNIISSEIEIGNVNNVHSLYLAPDHRIYLFRGGADRFPGKIDCPNETGLACGLMLNSIYLGGRISEDVFTNIPANFLYKETSSCFASNKEFVQENEKKKISLYPNPAIEKISFHGLDDIEFSVEVISSCGQILISQKNVKNNSLRISELSSGIYFVHIREGEEYYTEKLLID